MTPQAPPMPQVNLPSIQELASRSVNPISTYIALKQEAAKSNAHKQAVLEELRNNPTDWIVALGGYQTWRSLVTELENS